MLATRFSVRVRQRPLVLASVYLFQLASAWAIATPIAQAVAATGIRNFPSADALLFEPGALFLVEVLRMGGRNLLAAAQSSLVILLVFATLQVFPILGLLVGLAEPGRLRASRVAARVAEALPSVMVLSGVSWLARGLLAVGALAFYSFAVAPVLSSETPKLRGISGLAYLGLCAVVFAALSIVQDLARAAIVRHELSLRRALGVAFETLKFKALPVLLNWSVAAAWSIATLVIAAVLVSRLRLDVPSSARVWLAFGVHQVAAFTLIVLRALWFAASLRLLSSERQLGRSLSAR